MPRLTRHPPRPRLCDNRLFFLSHLHKYVLAHPDSLLQRVAFASRRRPHPFLLQITIVILAMSVPQRLCDMTITMYRGTTMHLKNDTNA